jgi:pSer/pThr/pTyr-binding forkhead associated (FHA) protein
MDAQRIIVAVKWGPSAGRKAVVVPGQLVRVGRGALADLVIPGDPQLSAVHLEIAWNGQQCTFRDLESARGTSRNGEPGVLDGELRHGDWLKAGDTVLTVHLEGATPPPRATMDDDVDDEDHEPDADAEVRRERAERASAAERALAVLQQADHQPLYAVLDAARDRRIVELLRESVEEHHSLYDGIEGEAMAHVAPYLVRLESDSRLLAALVREGWQRRWGIYLTSAQPFKSVRRHLRRYLMVERQDNHEKVYFRFYDPAVLRVFLPTVTVLQRGELFGALDHLLFEGEAGDVTVARAALEGAI